MKKITLIILSTLLISLLASCKSTGKPAQTSVKDDEFKRSTGTVQITREEFNADKAAILKIIDELSKIMAVYDYDNWVKYIDKDSLVYWQNPANLKAASKRLPIKGQKLSNLNDYFRMVFVPARKGHDVEEIRYLAIDQVKAVQVTEEQDIVYYNFVKQNGKWMVKIPALSNN